MRQLYKSLIVGGLQLALVLSIGGKLLYDRATRPRVWARAAPYDPSLPIRGRYVSLQLQVESVGALRDGQPIILREDGGKLVAEAAPESSPGGETLRLRTPLGGAPGYFLAEPVLFFIPENVQDPSRRQVGDELWVEVTIPRKGLPRPIRLGVKKGGGPITPLAVD